jgi:hypothetical protein
MEQLGAGRRFSHTLHPTSCASIFLPGVRTLFKTGVFMNFLEPIFFQEAQLRKGFGIFLLIFLLPVSGWPQAPAGIPGKPLSIAFSANVHGEVEPCG